MLFKLICINRFKCNFLDGSSAKRLCVQKPAYIERFVRCSLCFETLSNALENNTYGSEPLLSIDQLKLI